MEIGILFDLDGTLLDTLTDLYDAVNHTLKAYHCPERSLQEVRKFVGNGARRLVEQALPGKPDDPAVDDVLASYEKYYNATCNDGSAAPYPGVVEVLKELQKKYKVAVVSNKPDPAAKAMCARYFPGVLTLGVTEDCPRKPSANMVYKVMEQLGVKKCIFVGDSEVDVLTAKNAGVPCLSVLWGFRDKAEIEAVGGKVFCDDAKQLPAILDEMVKAL